MITARCRCAHGKEAHQHYGRGAYCALCGYQKCPRWRRLWVPRDRLDRPLHEGDPVQLGGFVDVYGYVVRVMSATEALIYWGGHDLSITESAKLVLLSRDQQESKTA